MSKSIKEMMKLLVAGLLGLLVFCVLSPQTVSASQLYFDEEGNLYFHTRDKKATGGTKYRTIGWVIKRYDMPMNGEGQQYVIVTKSTYKPDETDPADSRYVLCYFMSDKEEILNAVKSVSTQWYEQLYYYGDEVYIDSVMTVVKSGVALGTLYKGGNYSGEVYFTYEGIAGARAWSSPESLKGHYDMKVSMPALIRPVSTGLHIYNMDTVIIDNDNMFSFTLGHNRYGDEAYKLGNGIPSGESIYLKGVAAGAVYNITLCHIQGDYIMSVAVPVRYTIKWTDYEGNNRTDTKLVYRYYEVKRPFDYYEYVSMESYDLSGVKLLGDIWTPDIYAAVDVGEEDIQVIEMSHIRTVYNGVAAVDGGVLQGTKRGMKPSIPTADTADCRAVAESAVGMVQVQNDYISIDGTVILSNGWTDTSGPEPKDTGTIGLKDIYLEGIEIPREQVNGVYGGMQVELWYESGDGSRLGYTYNKLTDITVHTPVVCGAEVRGEVALGRELTIIFTDVGSHRDILGYGHRSYISYVGKRRVCCPFAVEYQGVRYEEGTWIDVDESAPSLLVCEGVDMGVYTIALQNWAYNAPSYDDCYLQDAANLSADRYGAVCTLQVEVVGWRADMHVSGTH